MVRLIIDEGGQRRGFRVGQGTVTIGSGEAARVRLDDPNVAAEHAELEVTTDSAVLRTRPGVLPATSRGQALPSPAALEHGVPIELGGARLTVEFEGRLAAPPAPVSPVAAPVVPLVRRDPSSRARTSSRRRSSGAKQSHSPLFFAALLLGVPLAAFLGWRLLGGLVGGVGDEPQWQAEHRLAAARDLMADGAYERAEETLDQAERDPDLTAEGRRAIEAERAAIKAAYERRRAAAHNLTGTQWLDVKLKAFEENWLRDRPGKPEMRLFVKRLLEFRSKYPTHDQLVWVERQIERFEPLVDLAAPPSWEEVEFEAQMAAGIGRNRITREVRARGDADWKEAFAVLDSFLEQATGDDRERALLLLDELRAMRDEWVADKLQQAKEHFVTSSETNWNSTELGKSIAWLVKIIRYADDAEAENDAAERIIQYQQSADLIAFLRGYRRDQPEAFADLAANPVLKPFLAEQGLLD